MPSYRVSLQTTAVSVIPASKWLVRHFDAFFLPVQICFVDILRPNEENHLGMSVMGGIAQPM